MNEFASGVPRDPSSPALRRLIGRPGAGKSTLALALAAAIPWSAICRDGIKEGLINTLGPDAAGGNDIAQQAYDAFFDAIDGLIRHRVTSIAEAAFQHGLWAPRSGPMRPLARLRIIVCEVPPALARTRRLDRGRPDPGRVRFHPDPACRAGAPPMPDHCDPPCPDVPTLTVDTLMACDPQLSAWVAFALA